MTFPTIPTVAAGRVVAGVQADTTATRTFPSLSGLTKNSGDLLIAIIVGYQSSLTANIFGTWGGGFTEIQDIGVSTQHCVGIAYKFSTGSETGTFTVAQAGTVTGHAAFILLSIPGAHRVTIPEVSAALATGTTAGADPASLNPANWDVEDTLWIAVRGSGETGTSGTFTGLGNPASNYTDSAQTGISADVVGGVEAGAAFRQLAAASEDVGAGTCDVSNARNCAIVIAVRPANDIAVTPSQVDLTTTPSVPAVEIGVTSVTVTPSAASLTTSPATPAVALPVALAPSALSLVMTPSTPEVTLPITTAPSSAGLTTSPATPDIALPVAVAPTGPELVLTADTPDLALPVATEPTEAALELALSTPAVNAGAGLTLDPAAGELLTSPDTPAIDISDHQLILPDSLELATTGSTPTIHVSANIVVLPLPKNFDDNGSAPTVAAGASWALEPGAAALTLAGAIPSVLVRSARAPRALFRIAQPTRVTPQPGKLGLLPAVPIVTVLDDLSVLALFA